MDCKEIQPVHPKGDQSWVFIGRTDTEAEAPILWPPHAKSWLIGKRPWCWEGLWAGGEGDNRGWDGWMASPTRWTWVWVNSRSWWWTGRPGVLPSWGRRVGHDWATELNWTILLSQCSSSICPLGPIPSSLRKDITTVVWYVPSESPRFLPLPDHFPSAFKSADRILTEKDRSLSGPNYFFYIYIYLSFDKFFSRLVYYVTLSRFPCAVQ